MDHSFTIVTILGLGAITQAILLLGMRFFEPINFGKFIGLLVFSQMAFIPFKHEAIYNPFLHYSAMYGLFMFLYSFTFNRIILPIINESSLLLFNVVFLFSYVELFLPSYSANYFTIYIFIVLLIPTLLVLKNALMMTIPSSFYKTAFYVWYLIMSTLLLTTTLILNAFLFKVTHAMSVDINLYDSLSFLCAGMIVMSMSINVCNVVALLPMTGRGQTWESRKTEIRAHIDMLNSKYLDDKLKPMQSLYLLLFMLGILLINHFYIQLDKFIVINIALQLMSFTIAGYHYHQKKPL